MGGGRWTGAHINGAFTATRVRATSPPPPPSSSASPQRAVQQQPPQRITDERSSTTELYAELDEELRSLKSELNR